MAQYIIIDILFIAVLGLGGVVAITTLCCAKNYVSELLSYGPPHYVNDETHLLKAPIRTTLDLPPIDIPQDITDPKDIAHYAWKKINGFAQEGNKAAIAILEKPETRLSLSFRNKKED